MPQHPERLPAEQLCKFFRLIEDYRRNHLNENLLLDETIRLPTYSQLIFALRHMSALSQSSNIPVALASADIASAFRNCAVRAEERNFLVVALSHEDLRSQPSEARLFRHCRIPFGLASSPYLWVRLYSSIHRLSRFLFRDHGFGFSYIDDLLWLFPANAVHLCLALLLSIQCAVGLPFSWSKLCLHSNFSFIGFDICPISTSTGTHFVVSVPDTKKKKISQALTSFRSSRVFKLQPLESLIGRLLFVTQLDPKCRHFLSPFFAVMKILRSRVTRRGLPIQRVRLGHVSSSAIHFWETWVSENSSRSILPLHQPTLPYSYALVSDASIIGIGALVVSRSGTRNYYCSINVDDIISLWPALSHYSSPSANMIIYELLGIALAIYLAQLTSIWSLKHSYVSISDNAGAVRLLTKGFSTKAIIGDLVDIIISATDNRLHYMAIPGAQNILADNLSRGIAPSGPSWHQSLISTAEFLTWCHPGRKPPTTLPL